jgi:hypothetical protein
MNESRTIRDPFLGKDVEISDRIVDRLRGKYAVGPTLPNGEPEFGWREFPTTPVQQEAADEIERLRKALADQERELAGLIARYYRQEIGCCMQQAEHWAKENFPLAVHHRVRKADAYYQVVALFERFLHWDENPFDTMRDAMKRGLIKPPGTYPPAAEIHAYRDPRFVVEKLKTASRAAGGPA